MSLNEEDNRAAKAQPVSRAARIAPVLSVVSSLAVLAVSIVALFIALEVSADVQAARDKVTAELRPLGHAWNVERSINFKFSPYTMTAQEELDAYLVTLSDIRNLEDLRLCAAELRAEATAQKSVVAANQLFPQNKPYNHQPGQYATHYARFATRAAALEEAARWAEKGAVPCTIADKLNWPSVDVTITDANGSQRTARVTDRDIMFLTSTLESAEERKFCASMQQKILDDAQTREVSPNTETAHVISEQDQHVAVALHTAIIAMLKAHDVTNC